MTLRSYCRLNEDAQYDVLEQEGVLLAEREASFCTVRLYALGNFYVEQHHHQHFNVIVQQDAFDGNAKSLDGWLQDIRIDQLFQ
jgi:hypothetical protein